MEDTTQRDLSPPTFEGFDGGSRPVSSGALPARGENAALSVGGAKPALGARLQTSPAERLWPTAPFSLAERLQRGD
jgi:hypothetical protein